jgi:hypothetical protein
MTWKEAQLTLQLMAEERIGSVQRAAVQAIGDQQDAASAGLREMVGN